MLVSRKHTIYNLPNSQRYTLMAEDAVESAGAKAPAITFYNQQFITLSVGDASIAIFRHESLTAKQSLYLVVKFYKAWAANQPGGRQGK